MNIQKNATILGGSRLEDYPEKQEKWYVVVAENAVDVGITGGGEINGQGWKFVERFDERKNVMVSWNKTGACLGDECRPRLVGFIGCRNVEIWDLKLHEPAYWWYVYFHFTQSLIVHGYVSSTLDRIRFCHGRFPRDGVAVMKIAKRAMNSLFL